MSEICSTRRAVAGFTTTAVLALGAGCSPERMEPDPTGPAATTIELTPVQIEGWEQSTAPVFDARELGVSSAAWRTVATLALGETPDSALVVKPLVTLTPPEDMREMPDLCDPETRGNFRTWLDSVVVPELNNKGGGETVQSSDGSSGEQTEPRKIKIIVMDLNGGSVCASADANAHGTIAVYHSDLINAKTLIHEMAHYLGFGHDNALQGCDVQFDVVIIDNACKDMEYGSPFTTLGSDDYIAEGDNDIMTAYALWSLGKILSDQVETVDASIAGEQVYELSALQNASGTTKLVKIPLGQSSTGSFDHPIGSNSYENVEDPPTVSATTLFAELSNDTGNNLDGISVKLYFVSEGSPVPKTHLAAIEDDHSMGAEDVGKTFKFQVGDKLYLFTLHDLAQKGMQTGSAALGVEVVSLKP